MAGVIPAAIPAPIQAYNLVGCTWPSKTVTWYDAGTGQASDGTYYSDQLNVSAGQWTARTVVTMTSTVYSAQIYSTDSNDGNTGYDGLTRYSPCSTLPPQTFLGQTFMTINTWFTDGYGYNERESVMVHEFGHTLGLDHNNPTPCQGVPVMDYATSIRFTQCGVYYPQSDDIAGVNAMYSGKP